MRNKSIFKIIVMLISLIFCSNFQVFAENHDSEIFGLTFDDVLLITHNTQYNKDKLEIVSPLPNKPVLVENGNEFDIEYKSQNYQDIYVYISTSYEPVVDLVLLEILDTDVLENYYITTVRVPPETPEELYNLTLVISDNGNYYSCTKQRSVCIYDEITDDFSFVHITDLHIGDPRGFYENIHETLGFRSVKKCIEEINLLHPDFVIISGDLVFGQLYPFEYRFEYRRLNDMLQKFDVPTFIAPGNHDGYRRFREDGLEIWQEYFGPLYYSFDYGDYHFLSLNSYDMKAIYRFSFLFFVLSWGGSISSEQLNWIENDLKTDDSELTFIFMHHNPLWETTNESFVNKKYDNREELLDLINMYNVDMVLAGHNHLDTVNINNNTIFITTTTPESAIRSEDGYWGYRLIEIKDNNIKSYNYKEPKYSIPSYRLNHSIYITDEIASAEIENDLEITVNVTVKFAMPIGNYSVRDGEIFMKRDNENISEIYVLAKLDPLDEKTVVVYPWLKL